MLGCNAIFNANQVVPVAQAISEGLANISEATAMTADYAHAHPDKMEAVSDATKKIGEQLAELTACASDASQNSKRLRDAVTESAKTADWFSGKFGGGNDQSGTVSPSLPVNNAFMGRIFNPVSIASTPPVGNFHELLEK